MSEYLLRKSTLVCLISDLLTFFSGAVLINACCSSCLAVDEEWQRTQCMPREACVDVAKELGTDPAIFFKPPCVSLHRCGGCCNQEGISCRNTSSFVPEPVLIKVANHTECRCMEPAIIRRNAQPHRSNISASRKPRAGEPDQVSSHHQSLLWISLSDFNTLKLTLMLII
uniref:Vascular endothelial growth factor D n=1 Tax=Kryptolebias marmoratus TaxID=37003 RepID=A0A3Q2ZXM0_KRYMA